MNTYPISLERLSKIFIHFAENQCKNRSPLYYHLSKAVSEDKTVLSIAAQCQERQPYPNLLFAAVHYLLLQSPSEKLAAYYPSLHADPKGFIPFDLFKSFCLENKAAIIEIEKTRIVQTNPINRTSYLMPIFSSYFDGVSDVTLIDIGASSGLNLNMDLYEYELTHDDKLFKFGRSPVKIKTEIKDGKTPDLKNIISIKQKIGIDQNPLDISIIEKGLWLKALIWPDHRARFKRMDAAIKVGQTSDINLIKGQSLKDFRKVIESIPSNEPLAVYHTHVLYQFKKEERIAFRAMLDEIGQNRDFLYLATEGAIIFDEPNPPKEVWVKLTDYKKGQKTSSLKAITDGHANWIKWL